MKVETRPVNCGACPQFENNPDAKKGEWMGKCKTLGVGRHPETESCDNSNIWNKEVEE